MSEKTKTAKEEVLESLKDAITRGKFGLDKKSFEVQADLQKKPMTITGKVFAKIEVDEITKQSLLVASDKPELEVLWNLQGRCIKGNNPLLDLVITL